MGGWFMQWMDECGWVGRTSRHVAALPVLAAGVRGIETGVVALLHDDKGERWVVLGVDGLASVLDGLDLVGESGWVGGWVGGWVEEEEEETV